MKIEINVTPAFNQVMVGNVYPINGGWGRKAGHCMIVMAITKQQNCLMLVIDKDGEPTGVTSYGLHYLEERSAIAFAEGVDSMTFTIVPLKGA